MFDNISNIIIFKILVFFLNFPYKNYLQLINTLFYVNNILKEEIKKIDKAVPILTFYFIKKFAFWICFFFIK